MPEICRFFGIMISMNYNDHAPPHFHARYGGHKAIVDLRALHVLAGHLPPRVLGLVMEWAASHQVELLENWGLARRKLPLNRVIPLV